MTLQYLQNYWWLLISVLGATLVFLLFVQGGQSMLFQARNAEQRNLMVYSIGRKWELTFTTLVTFGGAFFASFPMFYSTSFGGAYWLWILILFSFVLQAVSYEYRRKKGNVYGTTTFDTFLFINGCVGCVLLGVAVSLFFFGAHFTVSRGNLLDTSAPVISTWAPTHGFEAIFCWKNLILGVAVLFLARMQAALYMMNNITGDQELFDTMKRRALINGGIFVLFFLWFLVMVLTANGYGYTATSEIVEIPYKYALNLVQDWWILLTLAVGVVLVLVGLLRSVLAKHYTEGIWWTGIGTILTVMSLFWMVGYNNTAYLPSLTDASSSLTIRNSSSSRFTLKVMSCVSVIIPFVAAYIAYVWRSLDKGKTNAAELDSDTHQY